MVLGHGYVKGGVWGLTERGPQPAAPTGRGGMPDLISANVRLKAYSYYPLRVEPLQAMHVSSNAIKLWM